MSVLVDIIIMKTSKNVWVNINSYKTYNLYLNYFSNIKNINLFHNLECYLTCKECINYYTCKIC